MARRPWARRMQVEVEHLPDTLATLRESSDNIKRVSADLGEVVATLKRVTDTLDAAGLAEATDVLRASSEAMRATTRNMETAQRAFEDMGDAFVTGLSRLPGGDFLKGLRTRT